MNVSRKRLHKYPRKRSQGVRAILHGSTLKARQY